MLDKTCCKCGRSGVPMVEALHQDVCFPCFTLFMQSKGYIEKGDRFEAKEFPVNEMKISVDLGKQLALPF